jgi:hypothetical protein
VDDDLGETSSGARRTPHFPGAGRRTGGGKAVIGLTSKTVTGASTGWTRENAPAGLVGGRDCDLAGWVALQAERSQWPSNRRRESNAAAKGAAPILGLYRPIPPREIPPTACTGGCARSRQPCCASPTSTSTRAAEGKVRRGEAMAMPA